MSSLFLIAEPLLDAASNNSLSNFSCMLLSVLFLEASINQRIAKAWALSALTSTGTWYVAPPTLLDLTSKFGFTFLRASLKTLIGSSLVLALSYIRE